MPQLTIYLDDETDRLVKRQAKAARQSVSKWVAEAVCKRAQSEWPADVLALFGSWRDEDFPEGGALRRGYGKDVRRERL